MKSIRLLPGVATMLVVTGVVVAAETWPNIARPCAAMTDSLARVACYDQLYARSTAAAVTAATPTTVSAGSSVTAAGTAAVAGTAAIGDTDLKKSSAERAASATPTTADAKIIALREMRPDVYRISLDNGQVWQQEESDTLFRPGVGDNVRIRKGAMGRFDISRLTNGKTGGWARVTRLE
jgi:hypothetical protein